MKKLTQGSIASAVTIQAETVVAQFFPLKGPRGTISQLWMSLALQSFNKQKPKILSSALASSTASPRGLLGPPRTAPTSSSKSTAIEAPKTPLESWPRGRRTSVPETTMEELRPFL